MHLSRSLVEFLIYGVSSSELDQRDEIDFDDGPRRFTQDSPVLPDVWIRYGEKPGQAQQLLFTPRFGSTAGLVSKLVRGGVEAMRDGECISAEISYNQTYVAANLDIDELVRVVLPMTRWWQYNVQEPLETLQQKRDSWRGTLTDALAEFMNTGHVTQGVPRDLLWMIQIVGSISWARQQGSQDDESVRNTPLDAGQIMDGVSHILTELPERTRPIIWQVNINRPARTAVRRSTLAIKADAARLLFKAHCHELTWAVIDTGIDARHPAFWDWDTRQEYRQRRALRQELDDLRQDVDFDAVEPHDLWPTVTRVRATYDFTRARTLFDPNNLRHKSNWPDFVVSAIDRVSGEWKEALEKMVRTLADRLDDGQPMDWSLAEPFLRVPHDPQFYEPPRTEHGTHVAGILGAHWPHEEIEGVCPDIQLYDMRVLKPGAQNDEFGVLAALQFINYLNDQKDLFRVHGVNLSLAIRHDVANFACGRTPICDECERAIGAGVVVVAAAGNEGYLQYVTSGGSGKPRTTEGYHTVSITDPGNSAKVITVGSTHRYLPHTYGVSYFSSRGPTGDGRIKPDLVAPGEKVEAPIPNGELRTKDGTSMAAPHVSGAAAMLMARHAELIGQPERIKDVLCNTATDLGRERYFQGKGMLDVLRAIQSI